MMSNSGRESPPLASTSHLGPSGVAGNGNRGNGGGMRSAKSTSHSFTTDLSTYLELSFIPNVKPTKEEYTIKETQRLFLQQLADTVSKGAKLLPFGSMANGFALKNSDMDLCCFLGKEAPTRSAAELVEVLGRLIEKETNFQVKMLPRARIPIIKLTLPPSPTIPFGMQCDIGFENRLALENTRLLLTYALVDNRLRTLVLFLKVWTKRRKINNPYLGTLSSYGYVLLVIYFLGHVKGPPVLPNLQRLPPTRQIPLEELEYEGHDIYFYDDLEQLSNVWLSNNLDNSGQLLIEFFKFFSKDFLYNAHVISIRSEGGLISKEAKGWPTEPPMDADFPPRDQHKLCIEDPFQLDYNVARTVTTDGLYTIRGEFIRAYRILTTNPTERISNIINEVCEEREDFLVPHPPPSSFSSSNPSPRRRSAPSSQYSNQLHYPPPTNPNQNVGMNAPGMEDFRIWAAKNGVGQTSASVSGGYSALDTSGSNSRRHPTREEGWELPQSPGYQFASLPPQAPSSHGSNQYYQNQNHLQHSSTSSSSSSSRRQHPGPLYPVPPPPVPSSSASATGVPESQHYSRSQPTNGPMPWLERRVSWDGTPASNGPPIAGVAPMSIPPTRPTGTYDLHKFFQNQPMEPNSSTGTSLMTTPTMSSEGGQFQGPGRSPYRYSPFTTNPTTTTYGRGPSTSLPPRPTYPFPSSSMPATPSQYYSPHHSSPYSHQHQQQQQQQQQQQSPVLQPARYHHPGPFAIFPIEDRETIIQANTITFGNFDTSLQPFFPFPFGQPSLAGSIRGLGSEAASPEMGWPSPTISHPFHPHPASSHSVQNGFGPGAMGMGNGLMEGPTTEDSQGFPVDESTRGRRLSSSLPGSTISPSPSLAHPQLPHSHHPSAAGLLFDTPATPPYSHSHSSTSLEAYRTRFRDLHARTRGRSMPHSSTITKRIGGSDAGDEVTGPEGTEEEVGGEEDGEGEREVAMVKFGEVETEFFLPFPTRRPPAPTPAPPSSLLTPSTLPPTALPIIEREAGPGEVDSPDEMSELSIEVDGTTIDIVGGGEGRGDGEGRRVGEMEIPKFNTIPPTPVKNQRLVEESPPTSPSKDEEVVEEKVVPISTPIPTTTKKSKSRSTNSQTRLNGTRSPKLIPSPSPPSRPASSPSALPSKPSPPATTTTTNRTKSKSSPKLPSSPLMNGVNAWATVTRSGSGGGGSGNGNGGDRVGPIRLAAMNGISKLNLGTSRRSTSNPASPVLAED